MLPLLQAESLFGRVSSMPLAYLLLWSGSLALSIVLIVLLRTRWGQSRPLHKCAVLSLLVHLMLAWAAMTVRFIVGDGGGASGPPIRVRIVHEADPAVSLAQLVDPPITEMAPPLLEPPKEESQPAPEIEPQAEVTGPGIEPVQPAPVESEAKQETAAAEVPANELSDPLDSAKAAEAGKISQDLPAMETDQQQPASADRPPLPIPADRSQTPVTPYSLRNAPNRLGIVERDGGNAQTEAAVAAALRWLATAQSPDGRWDANLFGAGQEQVVLGQNRGGAGRGADTGISALAMLAFLGAGHSHLDGEYHDTVRRGLDFLLRSQAADGNLFGNATMYAQMYCHSMATFALAEAQAMTGDRRLEPAVTKAVDYCLTAQNAATGGWRYRPGDSGDTSQLGWQLMALASAQRAGVGVPAHTWARADRFLRSVRRGNYGGLASYRPDSGPSTSMTAEALYCRLLLGEVLPEAVDERAAAEASSQLLTALPDAQRVNLYYWYYATLALHYRHQRDDRAAAEWRAWNDALTAALLATQVADGQDAGSWNPTTVWGGYGGRVYTTAMAAMCLEVYYRYAPPPVSRGRWTATRPDAPPTSR